MQVWGSSGHMLFVGAMLIQVGALLSSRRCRLAWKGGYLSCEGAGARQLGWAARTGNWGRERLASRGAVAGGRKINSCIVGFA